MRPARPRPADRTPPPTLRDPARAARDAGRRGLCYGRRPAARNGNLHAERPSPGAGRPCRPCRAVLGRPPQRHRWSSSTGARRALPDRAEHRPAGHRPGPVAQRDRAATRAAGSGRRRSRARPASPTRIRPGSSWRGASRTCRSSTWAGTGVWRNQPPVVHDERLEHARAAGAHHAVRAVVGASTCRATERPGGAGAGRRAGAAHHDGRAARRVQRAADGKPDPMRGRAMEDRSLRGARRGAGLRAHPRHPLADAADVPGADAGHHHVHRAPDRHQLPLEPAGALQRRGGARGGAHRAQPTWPTSPRSGRPTCPPAHGTGVRGTRATRARARRAGGTGGTTSAATATRGAGVGYGLRADRRRAALRERPTFDGPDPERRLHDLDPPAARREQRRHSTPTTPPRQTPRSSWPRASRPTPARPTPSPAPARRCGSSRPASRWRSPRAGDPCGSAPTQGQEGGSPMGENFNPCAHVTAGADGTLAPVLRRRSRTPARLRGHRSPGRGVAMSAHSRRPRQ